MTFEYPQVDDRVIQALAATFAPFAKPEKPQLSPRLAASFIKNGRCISGLRVANTHRCIARGKSRMKVGETVMPVSIGFLRESGAGQTPRPHARIDLHRTCIQCNDAAQLRSNPWQGSSDLCRPSQFCNRQFAGARQGTPGIGRGEGNPEHRKNERISSLPPAKELGKGWRFFPTYAEVQTSPLLRHLIPRTRGHGC
jgi:hypothetical protein